MASSSSKHKIQRKELSELKLSSSNLIQQLEEDLIKFNVSRNLAKFTNNQDINIKRIIYRSITLFISTLGRLYGVRQNEGFAIIEEFNRQGLISDFTAQKLFLAVATACHIRLAQYMSHGRQEDIIHKKDEVYGREKFEELTKLVGKKCLLECLETAYILQRMITKDIDIWHFDNTVRANRISVRLMFLRYLGLDEEVERVGESYYGNLDTLAEEDYPGLQILSITYAEHGLQDKSLRLNQKFKQNLSNDSNLDALHARLKYNELQALLYKREFLKVMVETDQLLKLNLTMPQFLKFLFLNGVSKYHLGRYRESLSAFRDVREHSKSANLWFKDTRQASHIHYISMCLIEMGRKRQGIHWARQGLNLVREIKATAEYVTLFTNIIEKYSSVES